MKNSALICPILLLISLAGCAPTVANRGHIVEPEKLEQIKTGQSTREDVMNILGSPSYVADFDESTWYYVGQTTERTAFFHPDVAQHNAVQIKFNDQGIVTAAAQLDPAAASKIDPASNATPTLGRQNTLFQELFGGIGRPGLPTGRKGPGAL